LQVIDELMEQLVPHIHQWF